MIVTRCAGTSSKSPCAGRADMTPNPLMTSGGERGIICTHSERACWNLRHWDLRRGLRD